MAVLPPGGKAVHRSPKWAWECGFTEELREFAPGYLKQPPASGNPGLQTKTTWCHLPWVKRQASLPSAPAQSGGKTWPRGREREERYETGVSGSCLAGGEAELEKGGTEPEKLLGGQLGCPGLPRTWGACCPVPVPEKPVTASSQTVSAVNPQARSGWKSHGICV